MIKIVVFDGGWGGELVANFLQNELNVVEIVRVIDWRNAPYDEKSEKEICMLAEKALRPYIGECDLIVLGGYAVSLALESLKKLFPRQKFIGMGINQYRLRRSRNRQKQIAVLASESVKHSKWRAELKRIFPKARIKWADCRGWGQLINENRMTKNYLYQSLAREFRVAAEVSPEPPTGKAPEELPLGARMLLEDKRKQWNRDEGEIVAAVKNLDKLSARAKVDERRSLAEELASHRKHPLKRPMKPDLVLILDTNFLEYQTELEEIFGWQTLVMEFREKVVREICATLHLRGVDGKRAK